MLVLRAWLEPGQPGGLRVRITRVIDSAEPQLLAAATVEGVCAAVRAWLEALLQAP